MIRETVVVAAALALLGTAAIAQRTSPCAEGFGLYLCHGMVYGGAPGGAAPGVNNLVLEDGASSLLLEDGSSNLCLESGC